MSANSDSDTAALPPPSLGPDWAEHSLFVQAGRFPLSVEGHLMTMTANLVPGATTVTTSARYLALHGVVAIEAERRGLEGDDRLNLLRRCEVVMAAASIVHPDPAAGTVHGADAILRRSGREGSFDLARLSTPKAGYSDAATGFLGPYIGSELTLGILGDGLLVPGERLDEAVLRSAFPGLFELAGSSELSRTDLASCGDLAIGAVREGPDGEWLAQQFCAAGIADQRPSDRTRAGTVQMLARATDEPTDRGLIDACRQLVAYGPALRTDPILSRVPEAGPWRGTFFRHDSVGAWRRLWAWLTDEIEGATLRSELVESLADSLPSLTLDRFLTSLPATHDGSGDPLDAESLVRDANTSVPETALALLALGAKRSGELVGPARSALVGNERRVAVLSPLWMQAWLEDRHRMNLRDLAGDLTNVLLDRALRIARDKMRIREGRMWLPSVIGERGDYLYRVGREGRGNVGLRLEQLALLLRGVGVLELDGTQWSLGPRGHYVGGPS